MVYKPKIPKPAAAPAKLPISQPVKPTSSQQQGSTGPIKVSPQAVATYQARQAVNAQPVTVENVLNLLNQLRGGWSTIPLAKEKFTHVLNARKDDAEFWNQVVTKGSAAYGQKFMDGVLAQAPGEWREKLRLATFGGEQELTHAALMNQMAFMVYSNAPDLSDAKNMPVEKTPGTNANTILSIAGYEPMPTIHGMWGLQLKVFKPKKGSKNKTVVAFRGTEGLNPDPRSKGIVSGDAASLKANESGLDTMVDLLAYNTAYIQYEVNQKAIIDPLFKGLGGDLIATGHSLGGGLAQVAVAKNPNLFNEVYTFQGAGITKADVEKLEKQNKKLKARHYRVNGDMVPSSGEAAIKGQVFDVGRHAGISGNPLNTLNATGGHNTPVALDMLRNASNAGLLSPGNKLGKTLAGQGSRDPAELAGKGIRAELLSSYGTKQDTFPGKEALKQAVTGRAFLPAFISTYQNNVVYNSLVERALPRLLKQQPGRPVPVLLASLQSIVRDLADDALMQTPSTLMMLDAITRQRQEGMIRADRGQTGQWRAAMDQEKAEFEKTINACRDMKLDPRIIAENKQRFMNNIVDLWYSVHPEAQQQYLELKNQ